MRLTCGTLQTMITLMVGVVVLAEGELGVEQDFCSFSLPGPYPSPKYRPIRAHGIPR